MANMRAGQATPFAQRYAALAPVIDRTFDLPTILRLSVGPAWASIPPDQQSTLLDVFRKFTVVQYVANFDHNDGTQFQLVPENRTLGADQVVATRVVPPERRSDPDRLRDAADPFRLARGRCAAEWLDQPGRGQPVGLAIFALRPAPDR